MLIFKIYSIHFKQRIYADHILNIVTEYSVNKLESQWGWLSHITLHYLQLVLQRLSSAQLSLGLAGFGNRQLRSWAEPFDLTRACTKVKVNSPPHLQSLLLTKYSSATTSLSTLYFTSPSSPSNLLHIITPTLAKLPCPTKLTSTRKNIATLSPPTMNINKPDFIVTAKGKMTRMDQASECEGPWACVFGGDGWVGAITWGKRG